MRRMAGVPGVVLAVLCIATAARAADLGYLGPTPYLSAADSPFVTTAFGFCLEDFEDGTFDVPGASGNGSVVGVGGLIDSVDGDDGVIDGSGNAGHSYFTGDGAGGITITFTDGRANGFPTEVGIVWTDGGFSAPVTFEAFGPTGSPPKSGSSGPTEGSARQ